MTPIKRRSPFPGTIARRLQPSAWLLALILTCLALLHIPTAAADDGRPGRGIVSIGGSVTEVLVALGGYDRLLAVDSTSLYPARLNELPNVGYMRQLAAEPILALRPTMVLMTDKAGPPTTIRQLRAAGVPVTIIPDEPTASGVVEKIDAVAKVIDRIPTGRAMNADLRAAFDRIEAKRKQLVSKPKVLFLFSVGSGAPLGGGRDTAADGMIILAGGSNAADGFSGYQRVSPEAMASLAPDVLLVTDRTVHTMGGHDALLARPDVAATPAARNGRIVTMDGLLLLGFGPRTPDAISRLMHALHPAPPSD